jgi:hypothetical protein
MMLDLLGNKLSEGDLLLWIEKKLVCHVAKVEEPTLAIVGAEAGARVPHLTIQITFPVPLERGQVEGMVAGFVKVVSPASQQILERVTGVQRPQ